LYIENKENYNNLRRKEFNNSLDHYFSDTHAHSAPKKSYPGYQLTYGEMTIIGAENLIKYLKEYDITYDNFIDIGCGKGKIVLYMSSFDNIKKAIGVELVTERTNYGTSIMNKMNGDFKYFLNSAELINDNFIDVNYNTMFGKHRGILIWISNLCFSQEVNAKILAKIQKEFGNRYVICCSKELPHNNSLKKIFEKPIQMTWDSNSTVHAYIPMVNVVQ
jgi:hypothetical protein